MRRLKRMAITSFALIITLAIGVLVVTWVLDRFEDSGPISPQCTARIDDLGSYRLSPEQADNAALITAIAQQRELPARASTIALATAMQESKLRNITYGDRDSLGLFQQRPSQGWGTAEEVQDPRYATEAFFDVLSRINDYDDMPVTEAAQAVQRSAFPDAYAQHETMARLYASALSGNAPATLTCHLRPATSSDTSGFTQRMEADFPHADLQFDNNTAYINVYATQKASAVERERTKWAVAQWSVAVANTYGITSVKAEDQTWNRNGSWQEIDEEETGTKAINDSDVVLYFATPENETDGRH